MTHASSGTDLWDATRGILCDERTGAGFCMVDFFSGIGGFSLAAHTLGIPTIAFCECEPYPVRVLNRHWPDVPVFPDVKELTADALADACRLERDGGRTSGPVDSAAGGAEGERGRDTVLHPSRNRREDDGGAGDVVHPEQARPLILTAGFPCQDISYAGKGAGLAGKRSGLFFEVVRLIGELGPDFVLLENVAALLTRGADAVLGALADLGYDAVWGVVRASDVGAPHRRERIWIVAYPQGTADGVWIANHVRSRLTPWCSGETWPTSTASDAWAADMDRNGMSGKHNLGLGTAVRNGATWPFPNASDGDRGPDYAKASRAGSGGDDLTTQTCRQEQKPGSLNPEFVETLMGYPIGYTEPEGEPMLWLPGEWPAGFPDEDGDWPTPSSNEPQWVGFEGRQVVDKHGNIPTDWRQRFYNAETGQIVQRGLTQAVQTWPAGLGAPQHPWEPPRLTTVKVNRAARLKALGNSIVPHIARLWLEAIVCEARRAA